jgi:alpha-1,2-mannosyltransferase
MTTTRTARARVGPRHFAVLAAVWAVAATGHILYGNRHDFFDLGIYYRAVRWWAEGHDIYSYSQPDRVEGTLGFTYPPFAAVLMRPLGDLPLGGAQAVFVVLSIAALVAVLWLVIAPVATRLGYPVWFATALALPIVSWLEPVRETFSFGQINFIVAALIVVDLLVAVPRKSRLAGVGIGLAAAIKLTPAIFVIYLLLTRRWRPAVTAAVAAVVATLAGAAMTWKGTWQFWTGLLWHTERVGRMDRIQNQSLMGTLARLAKPHQPNEIVWVLLALMIIAYGLWRARMAALAGDEVAGLPGESGDVDAPSAVVRARADRDRRCGTRPAAPAAGAALAADLGDRALRDRRVQRGHLVRLACPAPRRGRQGRAGFRDRQLVPAAHGRTTGRAADPYAVPEKWGRAAGARRGTRSRRL